MKMFKESQNVMKEKDDYLFDKGEENMKTHLEKLIENYPIFKKFMDGEVAVVCHTQNEAQMFIIWVAKHDITYVNKCCRETYFVPGQSVYYVYDKEEKSLKFSYADIFRPKKGKHVEMVNFPDFFSQMEILFTCPFCGSTHLEFVLMKEEKEIYSAIRCIDCSAIGPRYIEKQINCNHITNDKKYELEATKRWNRRMVVD